MPIERLRQDISEFLNFTVPNDEMPYAVHAVVEEQGFDRILPDLVQCIAPRKILLVSSTEDKYAKDADVIAQVARETFKELASEGNLQINQYQGGHALTQERFEDIVAWIVEVCQA